MFRRLVERLASSPEAGSSAHNEQLMLSLASATDVRTRRARINSYMLGTGFDMWLAQYAKIVWLTHSQEEGFEVDRHRRLLRHCDHVGLDAGLADWSPTPGPALAHAEVIAEIGADPGRQAEYLAALEAFVQDPGFGQLALVLRSELLSQLALAKFARWRIATSSDRRRSDIDSAIALVDQAQLALPDGSALCAKHFSNAALMLTARHDAYGDFADAELAVCAGDDAMACCLPAELSTADYLATYAAAVAALAKVVNEGLYYNVAAGSFREAAAAAHPESPKAQQWRDSARAYGRRTNSVPVSRTPPRGLRGHNRVETERMILNREMSGREMAGRVTSLPGTVHHDPAEYPDELDAQIANARESLGACKADPEDQVIAAANLAGLLREQAGRTGDPALLREALQLADMVLAAPTLDPGHRPQTLYLKALLLAALYGDDEPEPVVEAYRAAVAAARDGPDASAADIAATWGAWAAQREAWAEAAEAYAAGQALVDLVVGRQSGRSSAEQSVMSDPGFARAAALAHVKAGTPLAGALAIERGRVRLMSATLLRDRAELDQLLAAGEADLAERLEAARKELRELQRVQIDGTDDVEHRHRLTRGRASLAALASEVSAVPGFAGFLDPASGEDLHEWARVAEAPLVYLADGTEDGAAIVVGPNQATGLCLPGLTSEALNEHAVALTEPVDFAALKHAIDEAGRWLWDVVVAPLLKTLDGAAVLIPAGRLGLLPLHAAWTADATTPSGRHYALDALHLRYAPSARMAVTALRRSPTTGRMLTVANPQPSKGADLDFAALEGAIAAGADPPLEAEAATHTALLAALPDAGAAHFACHALADLDNPLAGGLLLAGDEQLTVRQLLVTEIGLDLAVCSACDTATVGRALPDEVVTLPSSALYAGARRAIGSLWKVPDRSTLVLMALFYAERDAGADPSRALRTAQITLRDGTNAELAARMRAHADERPALRDAARLLALDDPLARRFVDPVHWAAFQHVGL